MKIRDVIFDLDGTLVDSAPDILDALQVAIEQAGIRPAVPLSTAIIGPPVREMLKILGAGAAPEQVEHAVRAFRSHYDSCGMPRTLPYPGIAECVQALLSAGCRVFVATNKPANPTQMLLDRHFPAMVSGSCCVDSIVGKRLEKLEMLRQLADRYVIAPPSAVIVGDGVSDLRAGKALGCRTLAALYGYGSAESLRSESPDWAVQSPSGILECLTA